MLQNGIVCHEQQIPSGQNIVIPCDLRAGRHGMAFAFGNSKPMANVASIQECGLTKKDMVSPLFDLQFLGGTTGIV